MMNPDCLKFTLAKLILGVIILTIVYILSISVYIGLICFGVI